MSPSLLPIADTLPLWEGSLVRPQPDCTDRPGLLERGRTPGSWPAVFRPLEALQRVRPGVRNLFYKEPHSEYFELS